MCLSVNSNQTGNFRQIYLKARGIRWTRIAKPPVMSISPSSTAGLFGLDPTGYETSNGVFRIYYTKFPETKGGDYVLGRGTLIYTAAASKNPTITAPSSGAKKTINCIKGKTTKKVSGANPKCPKGFKRK